MKHSKLILVAILVTIFAIILPGCEKQSVEEKISQTSVIQKSVITDPQVRLEVDWLLNHNVISKKLYEQWNSSGVYFLTSTYEDNHIEYSYSSDLTDISLPRQYVQNEIIKEKTSMRNARGSLLNGNIYSGGTMNVRVHNDVPSDWAAAVSAACSAWNALGYNVKFAGYSYNGTADKAGEIDIAYSSLSNSSTYAQTDYASSQGKASEKITINSSWSCNCSASVIISSAAKKQIMAHELGHAIGIGHTDSNYGSVFINTVTCAASGTTDAASIMISGYPYNGSYTGFSSCDKSIIDYYWGLA